MGGGGNPVELPNPDKVNDSNNNNNNKDTLKKEIGEKVKQRLNLKVDVDNILAYIAVRLLR